MRRILTSGITFILVLILTFNIGCILLPGISSPPPTTSPTSTASPIEPGWSPPTGTPGTVLPSIADVVARVKPSVVAINTRIVSYDIFNRPFTQEGAGSGWIIDKNGIIVTNNHVVEGAQNITVTLDDGRTYTADLNKVATDPLADLAIVKIDAQNLPAINIGDSSKLRVGDWAIALGNSLGMGISATTGIISAQGISLEVSPGQTLYNLIQTDAAINPGNSGGPLLNMAAEVIGINSAKIQEVGVEGMGYAISTEEAIPIIQQLINRGYVIRPYLGVSMYTVDQAVADTYNLAVTSGALITNVIAGSPADKAGIKAGDVITRFNGQEINNIDDLVKGIRAAQIGQTVEINYWRGQVNTTTSATLVESPRT